MTSAGREIVAVPVLSLLPGESPRLKGEDKAHVALLAEAELPLPPILVDRRSMRVIDGMHRLLAASSKGQEMIDVEFFDGRAADAFLRGVEANVTHGFPLSQADRRAAAARIIASHPHMSDRAVAESAGLAAKTVAGIRRSTDAAPQLNARVGRDGRIRPLTSAGGRERAAQLIADNPRASLREIARGAGISPATVRDVRQRLERGEEPTRPRPGAAGASGRSARLGQAGRPMARQAAGGVQPPPALVLEKLLRDPSLRHKEQGRQLLRLLQRDTAGAPDLPDMIAAVPPHCAASVVQLARQCSKMWLDFAQKLDERLRVIDPPLSLPKMAGDKYRHWPQLTRVQVVYRRAFGYITGVSATASAYRYAACATAAQLIPSAGRSTPPSATVTRTPSCAPGSRPAPRKKPSTPPAPSTSPGSATNQARDPWLTPEELTASPAQPGLVITFA